MPTKPPRIAPCCGTIVAAAARCACGRQRDRERKARHDRLRPSSSARGYTSLWESSRATFLSKHGACTRCGANATVVDHIMPHRGDAGLFWDPSNWQPLCAHCHNSHKQREECRA